MSDTGLFIMGMIVFGLMLTGLVLTMVEFRRMSERPDLYKGADLGPGVQPRRDDTL